MKKLTYQGVSISLGVFIIVISNLFYAFFDLFDGFFIPFDLFLFTQMVSWLTMVSLGIAAVCVLITKISTQKANLHGLLQISTASILLLSIFRVLVQYL